MNIEANFGKINGIINARVSGLAASLKEEDREDIKQNCLLKLIKTPTEPEDVSAYVCKTVQSAVIDFKRKNGPQKSLNARLIPIEKDENGEMVWEERINTVTTPAEREYFPKSNLGKPVENSAVSGMVIREILEQLSDEERVFLGCITNDLSAEEGMEITDIANENTYYTRISRLKNKIKKIINQ